MITACPKCVAENGPKGRWEALTAVEGGVTCCYHGFMTVDEVATLIRQQYGLEPKTK